MMTIFTPSFADEANTNAQNLSVKEIVARLDPGRVAVTMFYENAVDPRIAQRPNTRLIRYARRGNTAKAASWLLANTPDVYFFPREGPLDAAFLLMRRYLRLKTALVTLVISGGLWEAPYSPARQNNIREADSLFANNTYLAELVQQKFGLAAEIIYDGVDRRYFFASQNAHAPSRPVTVLFAGSFRHYKRAPLVVQQAARRPDVRFCLAGVGEEEQTCRNTAAERGCKNVEFLGHLSQPALGEAMRQADVFLFPSVIEGHPQVLAQAAASGLPAIAMKLYKPDYVIDGATGFLVENDSELAARLDSLIQQPELRRRMGEAAVSHARKFDWDVIARQWQEAFESAVAGRKKNRSHRNRWEQGA
jgi:glycosyltransferase involved in cell wall biosynthesis